MKKTQTKNNRIGQVILEFTFALIIVLIMIYGVMMIFRWTGVELIERGRKHEEVLFADTEPMEQIRPYFSRTTQMNAVWDGT